MEKLDTVLRKDVERRDQAKAIEAKEVDDSRRLMLDLSARLARVRTPT